jgi:hypothetical protein
VDDFVFLGALRVKRAVDPVISVVRVRVFMVEQVMVSDKPSASWVVEHHSSYIDENAQRGERFYVKRNPQGMKMPADWMGVSRMWLLYASMNLMSFL